LKVQITGRSLSKLKCFGHLSLIYTVEKMAIMHKEARANMPFSADLHQHHVKTENLHVTDTNYGP